MVKCQATENHTPHLLLFSFMHSILHRPYHMDETWLDGISPNRTLSSQPSPLDSIQSNML